MKNSIQDTYRFKNGIEVRNRVVMAPITLSACLEGGYVSEEDIAYYDRRSESVSMAILGSAYVSSDGQAFRGSYSIAEDDKIEGLARLAQSIKDRGALAIIQIYHGGRMVPQDLIEGPPLAPSPIKALRPYVTEPREMKHREIEEMVNLFLEAIRRAIKAGFDGVELHGANTYLIQQFLSPHSNRRKDKWGGSPNNRMRFAKTLVKKAKNLVKEIADKPFLIGYRFSPEEIENPGIQLFDTLQLLEQLIQLQIDYLHISVGDVWQGSLRNRQHSEPIIQTILEKINGRVPLIGVGNIRTGGDAQKVLDAGASFVALGQAILLEPEWTQKVIQHREEEIVRSYRDDLRDYLQLPSQFVEDFRDFLEGNN